MLFINNIYAQNMPEHKVTFCHDKEKKLKSCNFDNYSLKFDNQAFKYLYSKDSSIFYDVEKKYFIFHTKSKNTITATLQSDGNVIIYDTKHDTTYQTGIVSKNVNCKTTPNYIETCNSDGTYIIFSYGNCNLYNTAVLDLYSGSINMIVYECLNTNTYSWDISIIPSATDVYTQGFSLKILTNRNNGEPNYLDVCRGIKLSIYDKDPGVEFISDPRKTNTFNAIRNIDETPHEGVYLYSNFIFYNKRGEVNKSDIPIAKCE